MEYLEPLLWRICFFIDRHKQMRTSITYDELCDLSEILDKEDVIRSQAKLVFEAIRDWPKNIEDTSMLLIELNKEIEHELTKENLQKHSSRLLLNIGLSGNAWKLESIESLNRLFSYYPQAKTLDNVFSLFYITVDKLK